MYRTPLTYFITVRIISLFNNPTFATLSPYISSDIQERMQQLAYNTYEETTHLAELEALLQTPPYQDKTSAAAPALQCKINESIRIIENYHDYLLRLMYPKRSRKSLLKEVQLNCLMPVKLHLHRDGYFHIPILNKSPR